MMIELIDFFLGAIHAFVEDPELLPVVDAVGALICCIFVLATACSLIIWSLRLIFYAMFGGSRHA